MSNKIITLKEDLTLDVELAKSWGFEEWYQFGIKMEKAGFVDQGFGAGGKVSAKYLNWAVVLRVLKSVYPDFKQLTIAHDEVVLKDGAHVATVAVPYTSVNGVNFVEAGFTYTPSSTTVSEPVKYTTILPIMTSSFQDVDTVKATRMNYSHKRAFVKAVGEWFGLGLHLWTKEEVEQEGATKDVSGAKKAEKPATAVKEASKAVPSETPKAEVIKKSATTVLKTADIKKEATVLVPAENFELEKGVEVVKIPGLAGKAITEAEKAEYVKQIQTLLAKINPEKVEQIKATLKAHNATYGVGRLSELPLLVEAYEGALEILKGGQ